MSAKSRNTKAKITPKKAASKKAAPKKITPEKITPKTKKAKQLKSRLAVHERDDNEPVTSIEYGGLEDAFIHLNRELFGGQLPHVLISAGQTQKAIFPMSVSRGVSSNTPKPRSR
jgi:hypothetical protein